MEYKRDSSRLMRTVTGRMTGGVFGSVTSGFLGRPLLLLLVFLYAFLLCSGRLLICLLLLLGCALGLLLGLVPIPRFTLLLRFDGLGPDSGQEGQQNESGKVFHPESFITSPHHVLAGKTP
jgi:hypothetical protein